MVLVTVFVILPNTSNAYVQDSEEFIIVLKSYQPYYEWNSGPADEFHRKSSLLWDLIQQEGRCCGIEGAYGWQRYRPLNINSTFFPKSCCQPHPFNLDEVHHGSLCVNNRWLYTEGCGSKIHDVIKFMLLYSCILVLGLQLFIAIFGRLAICLNVSKEPKADLLDSPQVEMHQFPYFVPTRHLDNTRVKFNEASSFPNEIPVNSGVRYDESLQRVV